MDFLLKPIALYLNTYIMTIPLIYSWHRLNKKNYTFFSKKNIIISIFLAICMTIMQIYLDKSLKLPISIIILIIFCYFFYLKDIRKSIISVIFSQLTIMISETIVVLVTSILKFDVLKAANNNINYLVINIIICIIFISIVKTKRILKIYKYINELYEKNKEKEIIIYSITIIIMAVVSTISSYMKWPVADVMVINTILIVLFISITIKFINAKYQYTSISDKYQTSITSLKEYETMIDKFRVNNHENKNELLTIRNMSKNKKVIEYIDALVDNKIKDNENIMYQTSKIPEGGLRATIYSKLCVMDKHKIKYKLDISKDVRTVDLINLEDELVLNICKILGVFLDNAIEEVEKLKKKNINIELYVIDNKLYIDITNNYEGKIDVSKIGQTRQTSKGNEHGYGLLLVSKIINENSKYLENERSINSNYFTQSLIIKLK